VRTISERELAEALEAAPAGISRGRDPAADVVGPLLDGGVLSKILQPRIRTPGAVAGDAVGLEEPLGVVAPGVRLRPPGVNRFVLCRAAGSENQGKPGGDERRYWQRTRSLLQVWGAQWHVSDGSVKATQERPAAHPSVVLTH
jgi:hypothetical protein